jgi:hypothetical protein
MDHLPDYAASAADRFRQDLLAIFASDLVAIWMHGGTTFDDRSRVRGDIDLAVILSNLGADEQRARVWRDDPTSRPYRASQLPKAFRNELDLGFDVTYMVVSEDSRLVAPAFFARRQGPPSAVERAHWLAGQYVLVHGQFPEELVQPPTEAELAHELDREIEHLERHVYEGDANDPYEATYAVWNGCRVLHTLATGSPVLSKRSAGAWGLQHLPERWHPVIRAAGRSYDGEATAEDLNLLRDTMAPFVEMVRSHLPAPAERADKPPRWSGEE